MEEKNLHEYGADEELDPAFNNGKWRLSLENYHSFLASGDYNLLTHRQLNQVISIHGFRQPRKGNRHELVELIRTIELKDFCRSTLDECIHPAPMSQTEVVKDLTLLSWQTCPVVSVRSIDSTRGNGTACSCNPKNPKSGKKKRTKVASKQKSYGQSCASDRASSGDQKEYEAVEAVMIGTSCSSSAMAQEMPNPGSKRKRRVNMKSLAYLSSGAMPKLGQELGLFP